MYEERETFEPANLSILAMRSPERVREVFVFILLLYYQGRIAATGGWYPGSSVRFDCLEALGLSVTAGAKVLGVTRQALNNLVNEKAGISPEMAIRLDKAFGGTAEA